jgi:hypothetical protein
MRSVQCRGHKKLALERCVLETKSELLSKRWIVLATDDKVVSLLQAR